MPLQSGTTLGPYSVTAKIGEGGMGEVYRARDTKLDRDVALKVLPQAFTEDPDRLARFEREAKVLASLNHPNIGHIYGLEEAEGQKALVLELVEGPTLADRIAQGPIPVDEALPIAKQIAEALEAAHELGIIHRDLKPANVKVRPDGMVKVLDFGLAKALDQTPTGDPSQSPTLTAAATQMGVIMGTAAYMSPEQAKGRTVDKRGDVWAFGAVLYEMLTGQRAFAGSDVSDVLASVLAREPDWTRLPVSMSPVLGTYIRRCLHKDPKQRVADIQDVRLAMEGAFETRTPQATDFGTQSQPAWRRPLLLAGAATVLGLMVLWGWFRPSPTSEEAAAILRASITGLEVRAALNSGVRMAITRDGSHIAVASFVDGVSKLFVRRSDEVGFRAVEGTEGAEDPYFSPDGEWLVFRQRPLGGAGLGQIRRVRVAGGPVLHVTDGGDPHWGLDDAIVFLRRDGMYRVSPSGGDVVRIIEDRGNRPHLLPDGRAVLFQSSDGEGRTVLLADLESGEVTDLGLPGGNPQYVPTGHLVYGHESQALMAVPFDLEERRVTG